MTPEAVLAALPDEAEQRLAWLIQHARAVELAANEHRFAGTTPSEFLDESKNWVPLVVQGEMNARDTMVIVRVWPSTTSSFAVADSDIGEALRLACEELRAKLPELRERHG